MKLLIKIGILKTDNINHQWNKTLDATLNMLIRQCDTYANIGDKKTIYMQNAVLVLKDVHELLKDYTIAAQLKYLAQLIYKGALEECNIVIVSPLLVIPKEIEHYMVLLEFSHLADEEINDLVNEFNFDTNDGRNMSKYSELLVETIEDIIGKKQETGVKSLFNKGGTAVIKRDINGLEEFELITFLIVR